MCIGGLICLAHAKIGDEIDASSSMSSYGLYVNIHIRYFDIHCECHCFVFEFFLFKYIMHL